MKFRVSQWLDTSRVDDGAEELPIVFGIQVKTEDGSAWAHAHENGKPLLYRDIVDVGEKIEELKKKYTDAK